MMIEIGRLHHVAICVADLETTHLFYSVSNIANTVNTLAENGIEISAGPRPRGDGAIQIYIYDPDGHMVELVHEPWNWKE